MEPGTARDRSKGADELAKALESYEDGDYKTAGRQFQSALDLGLVRGDQTIARKHLAFIACASNRKTACSSEFRKALEADPAFELTPAEAGHPSWGPVFRAVKKPPTAKPEPSPK